MKEISRTIAELPLEKRRALERKLEAGIVGVQQPVIPKAPAASSYPLSFGQERLWFLNRLEPDSPAYNSKLAIHLKGSLDFPALERSLAEIVRRHETLRSSFEETARGPAVYIHDPVPVPVSQADLRGLPRSMRHALAMQLVEAEAHRTFDLSQSPLIRVLLLRTEHSDQILMITTHHIVDDGWSTSVFWQELTLLYEAARVGAASPLPEPNLQYKDFAAWERQKMQSGAFDPQWSYWRKQLGGADLAQDLPTDRARPKAQTFRGARRSFTLEFASGELKPFCDEHNVTPFMTFLTTWMILLARHSGQDDIVVGVPVANRTHPDLSSLIGFFANTVALRVDLSGAPTFRDALQRVRSAVLEAHANQELPYSALVQDLKPGRSLSQNPLFPTMFTFQSMPLGNASFASLEVEPVTVDAKTSQFDLVMMLADSTAGFGGWLDYSTDLFEPTTIDRLVAHFNALASGAIRKPDLAIVELPMVAGDEKDRLAALARSTPIETSALCLHEAFERVAERYSESTAVKYEGDSLTYRQLNERANQLAHYLQKQGVGPEGRVSLYLDRSVDIAVAVLGIMKCGAAYVPLDPEWPADRLLALLADSNSKVLVAHKRIMNRLPIALGSVVLLDDHRDQIARESVENLRVPTMTDNLAYVIYTSGSTGKPKGVCVSHANVLSLFASTERSFQFSSRDIWPLLHSYAFDFSVWEIWGALMYGGKLIVVPQWIRKSPDLLCDLLREERVTVLNQTASAFRQLGPLDQLARTADDLSIRVLIFGGETLEFSILREWCERYGERCRIVNMYGITETTVHVTSHTVSAASVQDPGGSVIGNPLPGWETWVLDTAMQPAALGVTGEIYVGGAGVSRGYLDCPDLTAWRFTPHPFSTSPGARLYRSGDLARWRANGVLEYLGRKDEQVKIRGFRIELGEIESHLREHETVAEAVAVARGTPVGDRQLVGYVVPRNGAQPTPNILRSFLKKRIPDYMIPAAFVVVDSLPLTANGKLDRFRLPAPDTLRHLDTTGMEPSTPTQKKLAAIWAELLQLDAVGISESFFEVGGHSLLATQLRSRVRDAFQVELKLRDFFTYATIEELAEHVDESLLAETAQARNGIRTA